MQRECAERVLKYLLKFSLISFYLNVYFYKTVFLKITREVNTPHPIPPGAF